MLPRTGRGPAGGAGPGRAIRPIAQALVAVGAAICAMAPGAIAAAPASGDPTPEPLWQAYPLDAGAGSTGASTNGQRAVAETGASLPHANHPRRTVAAGNPGRGPLPAVVLGAMGGLALALVGMLAVARRDALARRLEHVRGARLGRAAVRVASRSRVAPVAVPEVVSAPPPAPDPEP